MAIEFVLSDLIKAPVSVLYEAWLDSESHSLMTGAPAVISNQVGDEFRAWNGYIMGRNIKLSPPNRIEQSWRTEDFLASDPDSTLVITFLPQGDRTLVTISHTDLPENGMQYYQGWIDAYFKPMMEYFS